MFRSAIFTALLASALIPACATHGGATDELGGDGSTDGSAGKGDTAGAFSYYTVSFRPNICLGIDCSGFQVEMVGRETTQCGHASVKECFVGHTIDWSGTAMPESVAKTYEDRILNGDPIIVKGDVIPAANDGGQTFAATEIWVGQSKTGTLDGVFVMAKDNGVRCITSPCASITETRLNSERSVDIDGIDLSASGADYPAIERGEGQLFDNGVIIVGDRATGDDGSKIRTGNQFFTKAPVPQF